MATLLQPQLISFLTPIFVLLLVFVILYALLQRFKILGGNKGFDALAAVSVSLLFLFTPEPVKVVQMFTPWVLLLGILVLVIFMFFIFLGVSEGDMVKVAKDSTFITFSVALIIIIFLVAFSQAFGPFLLTNAEPGFWNTTKRVLFSSRFLTTLFLLITVAFAVSFITREIK